VSRTDAEDTVPIVTIAVRHRGPGTATDRGFVFHATAQKLAATAVVALCVDLSDAAERASGRDWANAA